jgi:hypothetical protein
MNSESHNPDMILEYFQSLKEWKKDQFNLDISSEIVQIDENLLLLREELDKLRLSITDESSSIKDITDKIGDMNQNIASTETEISELSNRINLVKSEYLSISNHIKTTEILEKSYDHPNNFILNQKTAGEFRFILSIIRNDIKTLYLDFKRALSNFDVQILLQYLTGFSLGLIVLIKFSYPAANFISLAVISSYLIWRTYSVLQSKKLSLNSQGSQRKTNSNINISQMRYKQQCLEVDIRQLQSQLNGHQNAVNQYKRRQKELLIDMEQANRNILNLSDLLNQRTEIYQSTEERIVTQIRAEKIERLSYLESLFQKWLKEYIVDLTKKAQRKLKLLSIEDDDPMALKATPVTVWVGVTERTSPSMIVKDGLTEGTGADQISELYIDPREFKSQDAYEGSKRKYGVYEFLVIFLCEDFLSYYKCYFNFIRRKTVNEEYSEYLYENIVFTKLQEESSVNMKNFDDSKQVYSRSLTISTNDGKVLCFRIPKARVESNPSEIDRAALTIRDLLRQHKQGNYNWFQRILDKL